MICNELNHGVFCYEREEKRAEVPCIEENERRKCHTQRHDLYLYIAMREQKPNGIRQTFYNEHRR